MLTVPNRTVLYFKKYLKLRPRPGYAVNMALPRPQPMALQDLAMDNLRYIRQTLERAGSFTAVPGKGGVLMGLVALAAERFAARQHSAGNWIAGWGLATIAALPIGIVGAAV